MKVQFKDKDYEQQIRLKAIDEVYRAWVDWNSGKYDTQYFDDVIDILKNQNTRYCDVITIREE